MKGSTVYVLFLFIIAIGIIALLFMAITPIAGFLQATSVSITPLIDNTDIEANVTTTTNNIMTVWWTVPVAFLVILIIWAFMTTQRKDAETTYYRV